jgi:hypothetical protein
MPGRERELVRRTHEALLAAGPLPELPSALRHPPPVNVRRLRPPKGVPSHRRILATAAAALAVTVAAAGYLATGHRTRPARGLVALRATAAAPDARAILRIGVGDRAGNTAIRMRVRGLPALPAGSYYEMYLTDKRRIVGACGTFKTDGGAISIDVNVPYALGEYSGWLIRSEHAGGRPGPVVLTTET